MTAQEVTALLAALRSVYPNLEHSEERLATWTLVLASEDGRVILEAALAYMRSGEKFAPTPGQLIQAVQRPGIGKTPEEAWEEVRGNIGAGEPRWSDPMIGRAAECALGPWRVWAPNVLTENLVFDRSRFLDAYESMQARDAKRDAYTEAKAILDKPNPVIARMIGGEGRRGDGIQRIL